MDGKFLKEIRDLEFSVEPLKKRIRERAGDGWNFLNVRGFTLAERNFLNDEGFKVEKNMPFDYDIYW